MWLRNTLSRKVEELHPLEPGVVRMYSCGPTVYRYAHLGNLRTYLMADWIRRALEVQGLRVIHVKNITDVGHMRQEVLERGEDKVIASALAEGKTPQEIAQFYTDAFHRDEAMLGILPASYFPKATDHIQEMIQVTQRLEERGFAYEVQGNVYFAVSKFSDYGKLSGNIEGDLLEGVRVDVDPLKRVPRDFTLWKAAEPGRVLRWPSPWGDGFPGWHIECSAMSTKYLGEHLDIHTGGVDNIFPHHEGELAQSECAFGKPFVQIWVHGQHLLADGVKMSKSMANDYTLDDLEAKGFDPMAFRYLCLTVRYATRLNFMFFALRAAQRGLQRLRNRVWEWSIVASPNADGIETEQWRTAFWNRVNGDLDMPGALALTWAMTRSGMSVKSKLGLILEFDRVLGLNLEHAVQEWHISEDVANAEKRRTVLRAQRDYSTADSVRKQLGDEGFVLEDAIAGTRTRPKSELEKRQDRWKEVSSSREVPSLLDSPDKLEFSVGIVACNYLSDVQRCIQSVLPLGESHSLEIVVVDNGSTDGTSSWLEEQARLDSRVRVIHTDHVLGEAAAKNILLKQSQGTYLVLMDTSMEAKADFLAPLAQVLSDESVGIAGPWGLRSGDLRHFQEIEDGQADAIQAYCFAFRRALLAEVDFMRESFRFYRNLDLEYSFCFLDKGYRIMALGSLPLERHEHRVWTSLAEAEREDLSQNNFRRFLKRWGHRQELLIEPDLEHDHGDDHNHD
jgi:cysteinyl-tRNA synthetase